MSATLSSPSLAQSLQGHSARKWSDPVTLAGLIGPGSQQSPAQTPSQLPSFSRTLQNQLRDSRPPSAQPAHANDAPARPREAERNPQRTTTREPEHGRAQPADPAARSAESGESRPAENAVQPDEAAKGSETTGEHADTSRNGQAAAAEAPADTTAEAAALAGLPAAIAALQAGTANDGEADAEPAADDSAGKALQNAGLPSKGSPKPADAGIDAGQAAQGRLPLAAVIADKAAGTTPSLKAGDDDIAARQPGQATGGHHGANLLGVLRHPPAQAPTPQLPVHTPANRQAWAEDVGNQVRWMIGRAESKAELVLTPPNIGKLEVSISLNGDQTTAQFVASSQAARDALEQALPRLREILQQSGISLGQADVSTSEDRGAGRDGGGNGSGQGRHTGGSGTIADAADGGQPASWLQQHDGMVDTFV